MDVSCDLLCGAETLVTSVLSVCKHLSDQVMCVGEHQ